MILAEALDTLTTLLAAGGLWLLALAAALALVLTVLSLGLIAVTRAASTALRRLCRTWRRQRPSWTRTRRASRDLPRYDEAA
ncbi:hypothetical protein ACF07F_16620 [Streptomyces sp. NPDC015237]|uniref:hypothetical protein n=1 Tax=Streptomyces sp. NPDC015237 TaxID=3364949 RepID=UPI0037007E83